MQLRPWAINETEALSVLYGTDKFFQIDEWTTIIMEHNVELHGAKITEF